MSGSVYGKMSEAAYGKAKTDKIKMIGEKLKSNIGKKAKVKQQGKGKEKQLVVTGDPDKVEIESLKRKLRAEKKSVSQLQGEVENLKVKVRKEKANARNSMYRLEETAKRQHTEIAGLRQKLDEQSNYHKYTLKYLGVEHQNNLQEVLNNSAKLTERAARQLKIGKLNLDLSRRTVEKAGSLERALRAQLEAHFKAESDAIKLSCKREVDKVKAQYKHERDNDREEYEYILRSFKSFHKEKMNEAKQYKDELITLYKHCNSLTKTIKRMEANAYPVRIKQSGLKMLVVPEADKPNEFENYLERRKKLETQKKVLDGHEVELDKYDDAIHRGDTVQKETDENSQIKENWKHRDQEMKEIEDKYLGRQWSNISDFVQDTLANVPEKNEFVYEVPSELQERPEAVEDDVQKNIEPKFVEVGDVQVNVHRKVVSQSKYCEDTNTVIKHKNAKKLLLEEHHDDHRIEDEIEKLDIKNALKDEKRDAEGTKSSVESDVASEYDKDSGLTPTEHYIRQKKKKLKKALRNSEGVCVSSNQPQNNSAKQNDPDTSKEVYMSKNVSRNVAHDRPESQNIKLDVFSVMKKNEKKNRPETARAVLMGRRTEARKIIFGGPVRNSGFGVATSNRLSQKKPFRPRLVQSARLRRSPRKIVHYKSIEKSVQTSRCEEMSQKPKSNREKPTHNAKPRRRNIQSASRAYEKRRKPGSVSPRRERRPRPHSAKVGMRRYGGGHKTPFYTTVRPARTFSPV